MIPRDPPSESVDLSGYDFIDLGCGHGRSIRDCCTRFKVRRGIGVDLDPDKVESARNAGFDAICADATELSVENQVRFASMLDFLEHLPDLETVEAMLQFASKAASEFLFISHPSFEGEDYLRDLGFRQYWWHWSGHPSHPRIADYKAIFARLGLTQYMIRFNELVEDSHHKSILTTDMPKNQHEFDPARHRRRPFVRFEVPVWRFQEIFVRLPGMEAEEWAALTCAPPAQTGIASHSEVLIRH